MNKEGTTRWLTFITSFKTSCFFLQVEICITQNLKSLQSIAANFKASGSPEPSQVMVLPSLRDFCITHVNYSQNKVSDSLAYFGYD